MLVIQQLTDQDYNTYIFGDDAIFSVFLGKNPEDGSKNYKLFIQSAPEQGSVSDPARQIGGNFRPSLR